MKLLSNKGDEGLKFSLTLLTDLLHVRKLITFSSVSTQCV